MDELPSGIPIHCFTLNDLVTEPEPPSFIIEGFLPADVVAFVGTGGIGKSTLLLQLFLSILLQRRFLGYAINRSGPVIYVTAEDPLHRIRRRLFYQLQQWGIPPSGREHVAKNFAVVNLIGTGTRLAGVDIRGNLRIGNLGEGIVQRFRGIHPVIVCFDPMVRFSPGERFINDGEDILVSACMAIQQALDCCIMLVHHVAKHVMRGGVVDHHAGRGGSALGDGVRAAYQLVQDSENPKHYVFAVTKLTDAPKPAQMKLQRNGFLFEEVKQEPVERVDPLETVERYLTEAGVAYPSQRQLEELHEEMGLGRNQVRTAVTKGLLTGRFVKKELENKQSYIAIPR
jgi:hypothetical protein